MTTLNELTQWYNLLYLLPILLTAIIVGLNRMGLDIDLFGFLDTGVSDRDRPGWLRRLFRAAFPNRELIGASGALFVLGWASTGLTLNHTWHAGTIPLLHIAVFAIASSIGFSVAVVGTALLNRLLPSQSAIVSMADFVGSTAKVLSDRIDEGHGRARVVDTMGNSITVYCRYIGDGPLPRYGEEVTLVAYDAETHTFDVMN